ncbi:MAG: mandelate racemase/muconate lactonizing enzyme family protein [bacterium]|nr:mandelate racemase/muconate lactonizing enzyme family protein [bacterium]
MKIVEVRAVQPETPDAPPDWRTWMGQILIRVDTDDGHTGYGVGGGGQAGIHVVHTALKTLLLGQDASAVESIWQRMYQATLPYGQKGLALMAISGVDLALWDLRGKRVGQPLTVILGGQTGRAIPCYKTGWTSEDVVRGADEGFQAVKLQVGKLDATAAIRQIKHIRDLLGPDIRLMTDAFMQWDVETAIRAAGGFAPYQVSWLEEPLPLDDLGGYERLQRESPIPIAGGEHEYTAAAFDMWMQRRLHTIVQPDVCWCGGLTELIKIYHMAEQYGINVCPHRGSEVWALHAIAALDPEPLAESGRPWITWVEGQPMIQNGFVRLDDRPGFGVTFNEQLWQ